MKEEKFSLGSIKIHEAAIAQIASETISQIEGVVRLEDDLRSNISRLFGKKSISGIKINIDDNGVRFDVFAIIKYGVNIPQIANKIQEDVKAAVEKMTNLTLLDINVNIQGVERRS